MVQKKSLIANLFLVLVFIYISTPKISYSADWYALSPLPSDNNFVLENFKYAYDPSINNITMTYQYRNITGSTINNPRVVNLFLWSNDICSTSWETASYDGTGYFSNVDQGAAVISPDGYFDWHSLVISPTPPMDSNGMFPSLPTQSTQAGVSYPYWNICTGTAGEWADNEIATFSTSWTVSNAHWIQSLSWILSCEGLDCPAFPGFDDDTDGVTACHDNCPDDYNPVQEDTYPPGGNGIGDACDCEGDLNCDGNVDATDVTALLEDFGRSSFFNPCTTLDHCNGDFQCDGNVDAADVTIFLEDFGRSSFFNPCPACEAGDWCVY